MLKSGLPEADPSDDSADQDEGFMRQRADMVAAGKGMTEKTAEQKMSADMQTTRMAALRAGAETAKGSSTSTSAPVLAQQMASSLTNNSQASGANGQDTAQAAANTAANTAGGQVALRPAVIQVASPVASNRPSRWRMAVWRAGRLTGHCCTA